VPRKQNPKPGTCRAPGLSEIHFEGPLPAALAPIAAAAAASIAPSSASTAPSAAAATAEAAAPTSAAPFPGRPSLVDNNISAHEVLTVEPLNGAVGFLITVDLDKPKPAGLAGKTVAH
jgi:hypothetical protein